MYSYHLPSPMSSPASKMLCSTPREPLLEAATITPYSATFAQNDSEDDLELMSALDKIHYDQKARSDVMFKPFLASSSPIRGDDVATTYNQAMRSRNRLRANKQRQDTRQEKILQRRGGAVRMDEEIMKAEEQEFLERMQQEASKYEVECEDEYWYGDDEYLLENGPKEATLAYERELEEMLRLEEEELIAMTQEMTIEAQSIPVLLHIAETLIYYKQATLKAVEATTQSTIRWQQTEGEYQFVVSTETRLGVKAAVEAIQRIQLEIAEQTVTVRIHPGVVPYVVFDNWDPLRREVSATKEAGLVSREVKTDPIVATGSTRACHILDSPRWSQFVFNSRELTAHATFPVIAQFGNTVIHFDRHNSASLQTISIISPEYTSRQALKRIMERNISRYMGLSKDVSIAKPISRCIFGLNGSAFARLERYTNTTIKTSEDVKITSSVSRDKEMTISVFGEELNVAQAISILKLEYRRVQDNVETIDIPQSLMYPLIHYEKQLSTQACTGGTTRFHVEQLSLTSSRVVIYGHSKKDVWLLKEALLKFIERLECMAEVISVPPEFLSALVGEGAQNLRQNGVHIQQNGTSLVVYGTDKRDIALAYKSLKDRLAQLTADSGGISFPGQYEPAMIGVYPGGSKLDDIRKNSGAYISVTKDKNAATTFVVIGEAATKARVEEQLNRRLKLVTTQAIVVEVPKQLHKMVLGYHGHLHFLRYMFPAATLSRLNDSQILVLGENKKQTNAIAERLMANLLMLQDNMHEISVPKSHVEKFLKAAKSVLQKAPSNVFWETSSKVSISSLNKADAYGTYKKIQKLETAKVVARIPDGLVYLLTGIDGLRLSDSLAPITMTNTQGASGGAPGQNSDVAPGQSSDVAPGQTGEASPALVRLKLLDALRAGDATRASALATTTPAIGAQLLHLAVQIAPLPTITSLLPSLDVDAVNARDADGNTPLHLAVLAGRADLVVFLLGLPAINDTIPNNTGLQAVELARDIPLAQVMQVERAKFVERAAGRLRAALSARDYATLDTLFATPRVVDLLDINGTDPETGDAVLHEFVRAHDIDMCRWILAHGGDPFKRDRRGRLPSEIAKGHPALVALLREAAGDQSVIGVTTSTIDPTFKGYLRKWTNFALGYKLRYFILDQNGVLSYYRDQEDTANACRGSLNLGNATLHLDSSEKLKFEILSGNREVKWHLKANHPVECNRWVWSLQGGIRVAKDRVGGQPTVTQASGTLPGPIAGSYLAPGRKGHSRTPSLASTASEKKAMPSHARTRSDASSVSVSSRESPEVVKKSRFTRIRQKLRFKVVDEPEAEYTSDEEGYINDYPEEEKGEEVEEVDSRLEILQLVGPHGEEASVAKRTLEIELSSVMELVASGGAGEGAVLGSSLATVQTLFARYAELMEARDSKLIKTLERQREINQLWERSIRELEAEIGDRERLLVELEAQKKSLKGALREANGAARNAKTEAQDAPAGIEAKVISPEETLEIVTPAILVENALQTTLETIQESESVRSAVVQTTVYSERVRQIMEEDSDDEFFDADEYDEMVGEVSVTGSQAPPAYLLMDPTGTGKTVSAYGDSKKVEAAGSGEETDGVVYKTPVGGVSGELPSRETVAAPKDIKDAPTDLLNEKMKEIQSDLSFSGYSAAPRTRLDLSEDNRPKISLWGILKSMVGKDLLKISLPVSFNECTSLLQRVAEDMEYTSLLDTAAAFDDSTLRMVYVATFAASEYASTLNRVAKPFNPLLGETYELARPDGNFRFFTEQVSHHPPISATLAESPLWDYYGESAVKSKFNGRSFDVLPQGTWYLNLRSKVTDKNGNKVASELYSWKKITSTVTGIISGSPSIDNYGEMEVTNHTTGDTVVLDFKQRGWRAAGAYEVRGTVLDAQQDPHWVIGGHWNHKIYAKKTSSASVNSAHKAIVTDSEAKSTPSQDAKFLVWTVNSRPKSPFNLTQFSISLNELTDELREWLPPTDTRLRPDQRAMEDGRYDEASNEKMRVEEKQRATRKRRELANEVYSPQWFVKKTHEITGESYWEYTGQYWKQRSQKAFKVEEIF
ncbi:hypothetical protein BABINDRAFT_7183 [Babjeviella inositovora NRRL Y-12698]|uniref:PH domain-containing protein n=1 Tax=Babjeviella inositovora NRRL Y-12698 TaxID=984486 RepID=A0A1E3QWL2_9ASCO|nr:uncharacterized protein BABINDRAFT_7183 [Babjeviella inositovora NRRL Y-12698]ODQ81387.1 hypothetical protein BABINDRAFT_7183 [Babjeviella inositovora NRRL Y-12698]